MHESSLVEYAMNAVELKAIEMNITTVKSVHLTCGKMRGAIPMLMHEAWRLLATQRPLFNDTKLEIEEAPIRIKCRVCGVESPIDDESPLECSSCGSKSYEILSGDELRIDYFEGE